MILRRDSLTLVCLLLLTVAAYGQYPIVTIAKDKINGVGPFEPTICISNKTPNMMMVSFFNEKTMQTSATKTGHNKVFLSRDFGKTWSSNSTKSKFGDFGDPCIIADRDGYFYYFHLSDPQKNGWQGDMVMDRIVCQRSSNGTTWSGGSSIGHLKPKTHEKPWATFDENSGRVYVTWTQYDKYNSSNPQDSSHIMVSFSDDRGKKWLPPIRINQYGGNCTDEISAPFGAIPTAGLDQDVYVTWAYNNKIYFDRSTDGGVTWLKQDVLVADQPGGWRMNVPGFGKASGLPVIGCDLSYGSYHGTVYICWSDQRNGEQNTDVWISKSTDKGDTWSAPQKVNDDPETVIGKHQCYSWMAVDPVSGNIYVVFYDRRNHEDNMTDVYLARSADGGATFINEKISSEPFEPSTDIYMGNYINISAYGGFVRPVWTSPGNGYLSILAAIIDEK
jgi:hypothetical protein